MSQSRDWNPTERLLTIAEAAASIDRPQSTIRRWLATRDLIAYAYIGRQPLILEAHLLATEARLRGGVSPT
ncbi:MAG: hypothetical protein ACXVGC_00225 [Mycobacteriaceae bacterium]